MKTLMLLSLLGSLLLLQACAYPISRDLMDEADHTLTFAMLQKAPDQYKGKTVILGGSISEVASMQQGTLLTIEEEPLDKWGKPLRTATRGRFLVYSPAYLDPTNYVPGRLVTVAGEVKGNALTVPAAGLDATYTYPVLVSREMKLWPRKRAPEEPDWIDPLYNDTMSPAPAQY